MTSQLWTWEIETAAAVVGALNALNKQLIALTDKYHMALELGDIKLMCEGEHVGTFGPTDIEEWGYTSGTEVPS